jgi:hypothetical protein
VVDEVVACVLGSAVIVVAHDVSLTRIRWAIEEAPTLGDWGSVAIGIVHDRSALDLLRMTLNECIRVRNGVGHETLGQKTAEDEGDGLECISKV